MEVQIIKRNTNGEEKRYKSIYFEHEESVYASPEVMFVHYIWNELVSKRHGHEFMYIKDWCSYNNAYNRLSYSGEGVYYKGRKIIGMKEMEEGMAQIEIKDKLFFIKYV